MRRALEEHENAAMDRLSEALSSVLDAGQPAKLLIEPVRALLEAFGEDWSDLGEEAKEGA